MIKILATLKKKDKQLYQHIEKQLEFYGRRSKKSYHNRLNFSDYLDLLSFSNSYVFQTDQYSMVENVLSDLNPTENDFLKTLTKTRPENYKTLQDGLAKQNNRTRQYILLQLDKNHEQKGLSIIDSLSNLKSRVFG